MILASYNSSEDINSEPSKAPSKRLEELVNGYKKVIMGKEREFNNTRV